MACEDTRQLTEAQRQAAFQQLRTGVPQAVRPFTGTPSIGNLLDYINRELVPAVRQTRNAINETYNQVRDNAPSGNPLQFYFSTETANADPTTGFIRLDAATQDTATTIRVSQTNGRLQDVGAWLDVMAGGATSPLGTITLFDAINPGRFIRWDLNTITDQGAYWDLAVSVLESSDDNPFVEGGGVVIAFIPGVAGAGATVPPSAITPVAANTVIANATASTAAPTAVAVGTNTVVGRVAGNIVAAQLVNAQITDATIANGKLATMVAGRVKGNQVDGSTAVPQDLTGTEVDELRRLGLIETMALSPGTYNNLAVDSRTKLLYITIPSDGDVTITGFAMTGGNTLGTFQILKEAGVARRLILAHESSSSTSGNRIWNTGGTDATFTDTLSGCQINYTGRWLTLRASTAALTRFPGAPIYDVMASPYNASGSLAGDDTTAINAAIAAANAAPGVIYLGPAHRITSALTAITANNVVVVGRGRFNGGTILQDDSGTGVDVLTFDGCQYSGARNIWIVGADASTTGYGVRLVDCFRPLLEHLLISNKGSGVEVLRCVLSNLNYVQLSDIYGAYGFRVHGDSSGYCHATLMSYCGGGTSFPLTATGEASDWAATTAYSTGNLVRHNGNLYQASNSGTSGSTGPSGLPSTDPNTVHTATITDGTVLWVFAQPALAWFEQGSYCHTFELQDCGALQGDIGLLVHDDDPGTDSEPLFTRVVNLELDHPYSCGIQLDGGAHARFTKTFVTSIQAGPAIIVGSGHSGDWEFNGGEIFGATEEGFRIEAGGGAIRGFDIGAVSYGNDNQFDAIAVAAGVENWSVTGCSTDFLDPLVHRYSLSIGSGCDNYIYTGNRFGGALTAAVLDTPGYATTRVGRTNIPDTGWVPDGDYGDITVSVGGTVWTIDNDVVSNAKLANMAEGTVKGRALAAGTGDPQDLTGIQAGALLRYEVVIDTTSTGTIASYAPTGISSATTTIRLNPAGTMVIRGMPLAAGQQIAIRLGRTASNTLTINHEDTSASADTERFNCPGSANITLRAGEAVIIRNTESRNNIIACGRVSVSDADYGDVTVSSNGTVWTIDNDVVSNAKLRNSGALSVIGRAANSTGDPADISATAASDAVLRESGSTLGFGTVATGGIANSAVTNAKLANMTAGTVKGVAIDGSTGAPSDLTGAQVGSLARRYWWESTDTTSSGAVNGYVLTDKQVQAHFNLASPATIRSFTVGTNGRTLEIALESTSAALTLANEHASGTLGLIRTPGAADLVLGPGDGCILTYFNNRYRVVAVSRRGVADRDYGDITVTSSGLTWTIDNGVVSLAKMADLAQSRIIGQAEGAGTGVPTALTPTQVVAIIDGENVTWTGTHSFTGASLTVDVTSADVLLGANPGGVGLFAGQATQNVINGDIALNASSGIAISAGGSAVVSAGDGTIDINGTTLDIDMTGNVTIDTPGNITIAASSTGATTVTGGSSGLILTASGAIGLNSPTDLNNHTQFAAILSSTMTGNVDDLNVSGYNVVRLSPNASGRRLRGMAAGRDAQAVMVFNTSTTTSFVLVDESDGVDGTSSTDINRFALPSTTSQTLPPKAGYWMWYDGTTDRWRMLI